MVLAVVLTSCSGDDLAPTPAGSDDVSARPLTQAPRLSCPGVATAATFDWGLGGPPAPSGSLSNADALAQVSKLVRRQKLDVDHANYLVLARHPNREVRVYRIPDSNGRVMAHVILSTVASHGSKQPDRWIADAWEFCI